MPLANILILGCARSGSSILGEFFESLPGYCYWFEPTLDSADYAATLQTAERPLAVKKPRVALAAAGANSPGLPFDWPRLAAAFPAPFKVLWIVRHPFDSVCSLKPGVLDGWSHNPRPPGWESLAAEPWPLRCAAHWAHINGAGFDTVRDRAEIVRYEDMVANPVGTARRLAALAGWTEPLPATACAWIATIGNRKSGGYEARFQDRWSEPNHRFRINRHLENLTDEARAQLRPLLGELAERFGYDLAAPVPEDAECWASAATMLESSTR